MIVIHIIQQYITGKCTLKKLLWKMNNSLNGIRFRTTKKKRKKEMRFSPIKQIIFIPTLCTYRICGFSISFNSNDYMLFYYCHNPY